VAAPIAIGIVTCPAYRLVCFTFVPHKGFLFPLNLRGGKGKIILEMNNYFVELLNCFFRISSYGFYLRTEDYGKGG